MGTIYRPTTLGLALVVAAAAHASASKGDNWIARRVIMNADDPITKRGNVPIGVIAEREQVNLSFRTANTLREKGII